MKGDLAIDDVNVKKDVEEWYAVLMRQEGKPIQITGAQSPTRVCVFSVPWQCHYLSILHISPFRPSQSHSVTESWPFRFIVHILAGSPLTNGVRKKIFHQHPNLLSATLMVCENVGLVQVRVQVAGCCEHSDEPFSYTKSDYLCAAISVSRETLFHGVN